MNPKDIYSDKNLKTELSRIRWRRICIILSISLAAFMLFFAGYELVNSHLSLFVLDFSLCIFNILILKIWQMQGQLQEETQEIRLDTLHQMEANQVRRRQILTEFYDYLERTIDPSLRIQLEAVIDQTQADLVESERVLSQARTYYQTVEEKLR